MVTQPVVTCQLWCEAGFENLLCGNVVCRVRKQGNGNGTAFAVLHGPFFVLSKEFRFFVWFDPEMAQVCSWIPGISQVFSILASACIPCSATCRSCSFLWIHCCVLFFYP